MGALNVWKVGAAKITRVAEAADFPVDPALLFPIDRAAIQRESWLRPHFCSPEGDLLMSFHAFVIEIGSRRIIVDTCVGNDKKRHAPMFKNLQGPFLQDLEAAGYPAETIDTVICTHMHTDHVGWNTRWVGGRWVPTFPNARYLFGRVEWAHWEAEARAERAATSEAARMMDTTVVMADSVRPVMEAGLHQLVETNHRLSQEVYLEPTPGHTPGHVCVHIDSGDEHAVITGDLLHHPFQCGHPHISTHVDWNCEQSEATRRAFFKQCTSRPVLVLGSHFATPTGGWIVPDGDRWRLSIERP